MSVTAHICNKIFEAVLGLFTTVKSYTPGFTKAFKNFAKYIIAFIFAKFKYFAKQIIYLESPDHPLQNDI